jgi:ABC-type transporter Mla subunit MlaD
MKQALEKMSPEELQKAMKNVKFDEEQFKKNIERTMKILKRLQAEQKADALAKRAEELAKKQQDIQDQMNKTNPKDSQKMNELAKQQNDLQKDLANIQKELKDLENLMKEIGKDMPMSELQKANDDLNPSETNQMMQQSEEGMKAGDHQKSNKAQNKAKQNLKNFAQSMKDLKNAMNDNVTKETMRKLEKQISNLMELSKKQEELKNKAKSMDANSTQFPNLTEQQSEMSDALNNVANSMMEMSEKSFAITPEMAKNVGSAMQEMQQAMQSMNSRKINDALQSQMSAMGAMNSAAMEMAAMLGNMQSSGSCSNPGGSNPGGQQGTGNSMMNTMQQLAAQQQGMSQSMQQMANGGKLSMEQQAQLGRMAKEQGSAQKSIEDLAKEQKEYGGDKKVQGDLDKISKDMQEVVTDMKSGRITPETMKRQERILSRLLDATRSMNDRDYEKNRESKPGENQSKASPKDIDPMTQEGRTRAFQEMLKSIQQGYTKDYENLIRLYFEGLQNGSPQ